MFVKDTEAQTLVKVMDPSALIDPLKDTVEGRQQAGQEEQPPQEFHKSRLIFPSGEPLPQCWTDPNYQHK